MIMKKLIYVAAMALLLTSCSEDFKDWADPQSNDPTTVVTFGNGSVSGVDVIDYNLLDDSVKVVKVCDLVAPTSSSEDYSPYYKIILDGQEFDLNADGTMDAQTLENYVISQYGHASEQRDLNAYVEMILFDGYAATTLNSNEFIVSVIPSAVTDLWYLVGDCIGDGSWGNTEDGLGVSLVPMYPNSADTSRLDYIGYFPAGKGFKLIHTPGSWEEQWGMANGQYVKNDGGSGNIEVSEDGYYSIVYHMDRDELTIEKYEYDVATYANIFMPGAYQGWDAAGNPMVAMSTVVENHDWYLSATYDEDTELKFAADGSWDVNWGNSTFPYGFGVQGGANIPVTAGQYIVLFNDILGQYYFMQK